MRKPAGTHGSEDGSRKSMFVASLAIHVLLLGVFPILLANFRTTERPKKIDIVFYPRSAEPREVPALPVRPEVENKVEIEPEVAVVEPPEAPPPPPVKSTPPVKTPTKVARARPRPEPRPEPRVTRTPPAPRPEPPRQTVRTNVFEQARSETVAAAPTKETRTAGFNAQETPEAPKRSGSDLRASARVGGFEVDPSPASDSFPAAKRERVVAQANFGGEAAAATSSKNGTRYRGSVKSTGFGTAVSDDPSSAAGGKTGSVSTGGFGDTVAAAQPRRARKKPVPNPDTPVEILSKPKPVYTAEARDLKVEGEVVLEVVFVASGEMRVLGVKQGLGHGLDEAAIEAARKIEFKPARRNGQPVDHTAVLRIVFQLA